MSPWSTSLTRTFEPTDTTSVGTSLASITRADAQLFLQPRDPVLQQRLLVLGVVVLGVLGDVSELARLADPISNLATPGCFEFFDLRLEPLVAFWGEDYVLFHADVLSWGPIRARSQTRTVSPQSARFAALFLWADTEERRIIPVSMCTANVAFEHAG